jgi:hypothetical protein
MKADKAAKAEPEYAHTLAAGFAHSCAISKHGQLLVWGDNANQ